MRLTKVHGSRLVYANGKYLGCYTSTSSRAGSYKAFKGKDNFNIGRFGTKRELEFIIAEHYNVSPFSLVFHYYRPEYAAEIDDFEFS